MPMPHCNGKQANAALTFSPAFTSNFSTSLSKWACRVNPSPIYTFSRDNVHVQGVYPSPPPAELTCRVYPSLPPAELTYRGYPSPPPAELTCRVYPTLPPAELTCRVYPSPPPAVKRVGMSIYTVGCVDVQVTIRLAV
jgi:hypothetical protein